MVGVFLDWVRTRSRFHSLEMPNHLFPTQNQRKVCMTNTILMMTNTLTMILLKMKKVIKKKKKLKKSSNMITTWISSQYRNFRNPQSKKRKMNSLMKKEYHLINSWLLWEMKKSWISMMSHGSKKKETIAMMRCSRAKTF